MALAIYQTILFIIIGLTIWLMIKPQRIPLNLSKTTKRILLVPSCFVAMFIVLGIFHMFGWDSEQVKANEEKKEALAKQEQWEQSILDELREDSIKIANWSPNMELDRIDFIAEVDSFKKSIAAHIDTIISTDNVSVFIKDNAYASQLYKSVIDNLHTAIKTKKLEYLNVYLKKFNSDTGLSVKIQKRDPHDNERDWVVVECITSEYDLSENYIKQLSEEVGYLGVKSIDYGNLKFNNHPRRGEKEMYHSKHIQCVGFDNNEWK